MTAEIAVMNKHAVALAADSAVTLGQGKIYNSANKLFALSMQAPVGMMIYSNAEFVGVPWESIIKYYRSQHRADRCDRLSDYAQCFISFLSSSGSVDIFPESQQRKHLVRLAGTVLSGVVREISAATRGRVSKDDVKKQTAQKIEQCLQLYQARDPIPGLDDKTTQKYLKTLDTQIEETIKSKFKELPINTRTTRALPSWRVSLRTCWN